MVLVMLKLYNRRIYGRKKRKKKRKFSSIFDGEQLEEIVKKLESGDIPLDDAIKEFNQAMDLAKLCDEKLKKAEKSLTKIVKEDGSLEDFTAEKE